jgi:hypothetical protein
MKEHGDGTECSVSHRCGSVWDCDGRVRQYLGVPVTLVGKTLDFWKTNMPRGMFLRSGPDWHVDARDVVTFEAYLNMGGLMHAHVKPVPLDMFLGLCELVHGTV